ncbi:hypothetical protein M2459_003338 [Parabacteroides sp. PF5-5]|uniref:PepSY-like domain-containing protein n=1 Tax=unclassified Parabacteroides TaxID=2649774 RepID=UPI002476CB34|nr:MULTISPECIES: PepSY-like domain-containing protein [unclassified Parabacteroides]MDH6306669.1 hypothetical protein [Parabacteroides sp. PH5-39]MDH6317636.1 hypothetical protein [Parabacteroides sp. PF5-13]MDH6321380.1 hypothetical protein [Parabacteroides sp. PH5-13]MDH6325055.1 hypothetical protein [Parabacteroides sp. PH5-8]MDH6328764.1 hypothetical protein [Parabacteroides sp. PH5-41]
MDKRVSHWAFIAIIAYIFTACSSENGGIDKEDPSENTSITPNELVLKSFKNQYTNAQHITWDTTGGYYVADFEIENQPIVAWFSEQGKCFLEQTNIPHNQIGTSVSNSLANSAFSDWEINKTYTLEKLGFSSVYMIEMANSSEQSMLYFTKHGDFIKRIENSQGHIETPTIIPDAISTIINQLFDNPELVDITEVNSVIDEISVGVLDNTLYKVAALDSNYEWISTFWHLAKEAVPSIVWEGFVNSDYYIYNLQEIKAMEDSQKINYIFYVEDSEEKMHILSFDSSGVLHSVLS